MSLKGTKTEENLIKALAGESIARNKYTYYAQVARENGDTHIAEAFEQMAKNEMMHARFWFEALYGKPESTDACLMQAAQGEYSEWHDMYPAFAGQARADGLEELAVMFEKVAAIERSHENRFLTLLAKRNSAGQEAPAPQTPAKPAPKEKREGWRCQFCGAVFQKRPDVCGVCKAIGVFEYVEYFE